MRTASQHFEPRPTPAGWAREPRDGDEPPEQSGAADPQTRVKVRRSIRCRRCGEEISDTDALFPVDDDRIARTFQNPHGHLHEIITARKAWGLVYEGPPTTEFTWFAGYAWEIAYCQGCHSHLGWRFGAVGDSEPTRFWGLVRKSVVEG